MSVWLRLSRVPAIHCALCPASSETQRREGRGLLLGHPFSLVFVRDGGLALGTSPSLI